MLNGALVTIVIVPCLKQLSGLLSGFNRSVVFLGREKFMDLLTKLDEKIVLALETIELLNMENEELKEEVTALKAQNNELSEQKSSWETRVNDMLDQFGSEVAALTSNDDKS